ncbi:MAG: hypothetical protein WBA13_07190 [Microcoleaceae cyanobacterium]
MEKIFKLISHRKTEDYLTEVTDFTDKIRENTMQDLDSLSEDLKHISVVVDSIQNNYKALLKENQQMKSVLKQLIEDCYCWEGNRCQKCQKIIETLLGKNTEQQPESVNNDYKSWEELRKLG